LVHNNFNNQKILKTSTSLTGEEQNQMQMWITYTC